MKCSKMVVTQSRRRPQFEEEANMATSVQMCFALGNYWI